MQQPREKWCNNVKFVASRWLTFTQCDVVGLIWRFIQIPVQPQTQLCHRRTHHNEENPTKRIRLHKPEPCKVPKVPKVPTCTVSALAVGSHEVLFTAPFPTTNPRLTILQLKKEIRRHVPRFKHTALRLFAHDDVELAHEFRLDTQLDVLLTTHSHESQHINFVVVVTNLACSQHHTLAPSKSAFKVWHPIKHILATANPFGQVELWDTDSGKRDLITHVHYKYLVVGTGGWDPTGRYLPLVVWRQHDSLEKTGEVDVWDAHTRKFITGPDDICLPSRGDAHWDCTGTYMFVNKKPTGTCLIHELYIWNVKTNTLVCKVDSDTRSDVPTWHPTKQVFVTVDAHHLQFWQFSPEGGRVERTERICIYFRTRYIVFSPCGRYIKLDTSYHQSLEILDTVTKTTKRYFTNTPCTGFAWHPSSEYFLFARQPLGSTTCVDVVNMNDPVSNTLPEKSIRVWAPRKFRSCHKDFTRFSFRDTHQTVVHRLAPATDEHVFYFNDNGDKDDEDDGP